jgi:DNA replication and repair protein RecF
MGREDALIKLWLSKRTGTHEIECRLHADKPREWRIDGKPLSRSGELLGCLHVVLFAPEDLKLVKQGPSERRRFLDMEISQMDPPYYYALQEYNTALRQRNALLKEKDASEKLFFPWEQQLSALGAKIILKRADFVERLKRIASLLHQELTDAMETLSVAYSSAVPLEREANMASSLYKAMQTNRERDFMRGNTGVGPHRDDMLITLNGAELRMYGSQGQQRTAALAMKMSELFLLREENREPPVLLLDDVLSELDRERQRRLVSAIGDCQTFITCTELQGLKEAGAGNFHVFSVGGGAVASVSQARVG